MKKDVRKMQKKAQEQMPSEYQIRAEIEEAEDPGAHLAAIRERLNRVRSPFRTAEIFGIEDIIDPRDTRPLLCEFADLAWRALGEQP